ncbi:hypothetical protein SDC9_211150 [bioreactor metagenome]|uniref:Uncharacterized protein n=1 Tax=bioreactor metagenome TaxID=1076179 RepID=A0A645JJI1_9ZZZZ
MTRADIGKADIPAAPIIGLILDFVNKLMNFTNKTPKAVSKTKAKSPSPMIIAVSTVTKSAACIRDAMVMPKRRVTRLTSSFCAVWEREFKTPLSRMRFPNISIPIRDREVGAIRPATTDTPIGKSIFAVLDISLDW